MARNRNTHYHVGYNVPSYLPENEVEVYRTKADANYRMAAIKEGFREDNGDSDLDHHYVFDGSVRSGFIVVADRNREHDLGWVLYRDECDDERCLRGEE